MYNNDCIMSYKNLSHELTNWNKEQNFLLTLHLDDIEEGF
jgi:hypothetical protein